MAGHGSHPFPLPRPRSRSRGARSSRAPRPRNATCHSHCSRHDTPPAPVLLANLRPAIMRHVQLADPGKSPLSNVFPSSRPRRDDVSGPELPRWESRFISPHAREHDTAPLMHPVIRAFSDGRSLCGLCWRSDGCTRFSSSTASPPAVQKRAHTKSAEKGPNDRATWLSCGPCKSNLSQAAVTAANWVTCILGSLKEGSVSPLMRGGSYDQRKERAGRTDRPA